MTIVISRKRCMKIGAKTLNNNSRMKTTADEIDVATKPSFGQSENGHIRNAINGGKGKR